MRRTVAASFKTAGSIMIRRVHPFFAAGLLLLSVVAVALGPATAEPLVTQTVYYYDVAGASAPEVRADLNRHGPFDLQGRRFDGYTRWYVRWRYNYGSGPLGCTIANVTTAVDIGITLPRLNADAPASDDLKRVFSNYVEKLRLHEDGHAQVAIEIARRIESGIASLPPEPACDRLGQVANELGHSLIREANQQDIDYDARTQHGRTQGVQFP
jgi:predicted secreted Zn-dependent protease